MTAAKKAFILQKLLLSSFFICEVTTEYCHCNSNKIVILLLVKVMQLQWFRIIIRSLHLITPSASLSKNILFYVSLQSADIYFIIINILFLFSQVLHYSTLLQSIFMNRDFYRNNKLTYHYLLHDRLLPQRPKEEKNMTERWQGVLMFSTTGSRMEIGALVGSVGLFSSPSPHLMSLVAKSLTKSRSSAMSMVCLETKHLTTALPTILHFTIYVFMNGSSTM